MKISDQVKENIDPTTALFLVVAKLIALGENGMDQKENTLLRSLVHRQKMALFTIEYKTRTQPEGIPLTMIANELEIPLSSTSLLIESLVKKGLCQRVINPRNHRSVNITLTDFGRKITKKMIARTGKRLKELQVGLSPQEIATFNNVILYYSRQWGKGKCNKR